MLNREIIDVCFQIEKNTLCGQNIEFLNVKLPVHGDQWDLHNLKLVSNAPADASCDCFLQPSLLYDYMGFVNQLTELYVFHAS
jgi:hypothetical protein